jgi:TetR/AcrR family transcriptional repressor of nem operon
MPYSSEHKVKSKGRILDSATELFCRYGFDKVSINQVMKLAKLTHGAFYTHFESKEALYRETFREALNQSQASRLMKGPYSIQNLTNLVSGYLNLRDLDQPDCPRPEALLSNDIGSDNLEVKKLYEESYFSLLRLLENRLIALSRLKTAPLRLKPEQARDKSRAILASKIGAIAIAKSITVEKEREHILKAAQNQIFSMLGLAETDIKKSSKLTLSNF